MTNHLEMRGRGSGRQCFGVIPVWVWTRTLSSLIFVTLGRSLHLSGPVESSVRAVFSVRAMCLASVLPFIGPFICLLTKSWESEVCMLKWSWALEMRINGSWFLPSRAQHIAPSVLCHYGHHGRGFSVAILQDFLPGLSTFIVLVTWEQPLFLGNSRPSSLDGLPDQKNQVFLDPLHFESC